MLTVIARSSDKNSFCQYVMMFFFFFLFKFGILTKTIKHFLKGKTHSFKCLRQKSSCAGHSSVCSKGPVRRKQEVRETLKRCLFLVGVTFYQQSAGLSTDKCIWKRCQWSWWQSGFFSRGCSCCWSVFKRKGSPTGSYFCSVGHYSHCYSNISSPDWL